MPTAVSQHEKEIVLKSVTTARVKSFSIYTKHALLNRLTFPKSHPCTVEMKACMRTVFTSLCVPVYTPDILISNRG